MVLRRIFEYCSIQPNNGGEIIDVAGLTITDPVALEQDMNQVPGVVAVGCSRCAAPTSALCAMSARAK
jgi:ribose 5-phosphate isomerase A